MCVDIVFPTCCLIVNFGNVVELFIVIYLFFLREGDMLFITNLACNKLIMKVMQSSFIHRFVHFTHEYHALETHLTHG
jgi:hypothetical protein